MKQVNRPQLSAIDQEVPLSYCPPSFFQPSERAQHGQKQQVVGFIGGAKEF